jgi:hypothetical protein
VYAPADFNLEGPMTITNVWRVLSLAAVTLALSAHGVAQGHSQSKFAGLFNDYTAALDANGPWHIVGDWSLALSGDSGKGDFSAALAMVRADNANRSFHTHHVTLTDGVVTPLTNGYRISGNAVMTVNGNLAGFSGSPIDVEITGGNAVPFSNLSITFGGGAVNHFGDQPIDGVVTGKH